MRRDGDSNPGNPFGVYTLSRRASSTTRASLPWAIAEYNFSAAAGHFSIVHSKSRAKVRKFFETAIVFRYFFCFFFILCQKVCSHWLLLPVSHPLWIPNKGPPIVLPHRSSIGSHCASRGGEPAPYKERPFP